MLRVGSIKMLCISPRDIVWSNDSERVNSSGRSNIVIRSCCVSSIGSICECSRTWLCDRKGILQEAQASRDGGGYRDETGVVHKLLHSFAIESALSTRLTHYSSKDQLLYKILTPSTFETHSSSVVPGRSPQQILTPQLSSSFEL